MELSTQEMITALNNINAKPFMGEMGKEIEEIGKSVKKKDRVVKVKIGRKFTKKEDSWGSGGCRWERPVPVEENSWTKKIDKRHLRWIKQRLHT